MGEIRRLEGMGRTRRLPGMCIVHCERLESRRCDSRSAQAGSNDSSEKVSYRGRFLESFYDEMPIIEMRGFNLPGGLRERQAR